MKLLNAVTVAALLATASLAHAQSMGEGFDMLTAALTSDFERMGIPTDSLDDLTIGQLAVIKTVLTSDESDGQKKGRIEAIIANN